MLVQPVISRELKAQARARANYWLRLLAGGTAAVVFVVAVGAYDDLPSARLGLKLFALLHTCICIVLCLACPFMTADTLARERREATLGLLLLTPLRPGDVVLGKMAVHLLRAFTIWLSVLPVLIVPLLLGGIAPTDIGIALVFECSVVLFSLAGGLLASSHTVRWGAATTLAFLYTVLLGEALALGSFCAFLARAWLGGELLPSHPSDCLELIGIGAIIPWMVGSGFPGGDSGWAANLTRVPVWAAVAIHVALGALIVGSLFIFARVGWLAARRIQTLGETRVRTKRQEKWHRFWFRLRAPRFYFRRRRSLLERNPLLWLYTLRPSFRLNRWGWCGLVAVVWCILSADVLSVVAYDTAIIVPCVLTGALTLAASAAFRREMAEGTLEMLLVTPLRPATILRARFWSLWWDFFPALALGTGLALWLHSRSFGLRDSWDSERPNFLPTLVGIWSTFMAAPFIAARFAVRRVNPISSWLWTAAIGIGVPAMAGALSTFWVRVGGASPGQWAFAVGFTVLQFVLAGLCRWATVTDLESRKYLLRPFGRVPR